MIFYFGTFNPIHEGHIEISRNVYKVYQEDIIFVPAYDSPWKPDLKESFEHRCNMIKLCGGIVSDIEKTLPTPSYTYQTVEEFYKDYKPVKMIIGYDQFFSLEKWKHPEILQTYCEFIVIPRDVGIYGADLNWEYRNRVNDGWKAKLLPMPLLSISSSMIREQIQKQEIPKGLNKKVLEYIKENDLY